MLKEGLGTGICNYPCSKLDLTPHTLRAHFSSVYACGEVVLISSTGQVTSPLPPESTCHEKRLQSQQLITTAYVRWRESHTSEYSWLFVCGCGVSLLSK